MSQYEYYLTNLPNHGGVEVRSIETDSTIVCQMTNDVIGAKQVTALADYSLISSWTQGLLGEALTVIDAVVSSEQQNKAAKDIMRHKFYKIMEVQEEFMQPISTLKEED